MSHSANEVPEDNIQYLTTWSVRDTCVILRVCVFVCLICTYVSLSCERMQFNSRIIDFHALVSFTEGDTMTTEMQEIAITEDKPLLTGQADAKVRVPHTHTHILKPQIHDKMYVCVCLLPRTQKNKGWLVC